MSKESSEERSYWLKSGLLTMMQHLSVLIFGLVGFMLLIRILPEEKYSTWVIFIITVSFLEVGRAGLLQNGLVKYLTTSTEEDYGKISTASLVLNLILTLISVVLLLFFAESSLRLWEYSDLPKMFRIYALTTLLLLPFQQFNFVQQANLDFTGIFWSNFTKQGLMFLYILIFFLIGASIEVVDLAKFQVFTAVVASFVSYMFARPYIRFSKKIDWSWVNELFQYGKYVFGTNLSTMLYKNIDRWMLGAIIGAKAPGMYDAAIRINNMIEAPTLSIASIVFPKSARSNAKANNEEICLMYERAVGAIMAITLPAILFVFLFPEFIMSIIAGAKYTNVAPILALTVLFGLFFPFANQFGTILDSIGKPQINFVFVIIGAVLNIGFNYYFIKEFGIIGAAYGTLCTYTVTFILNQILLNRMFGVKFWRVFGHAIFFYKEGYKMLMTKLNKNPEAVIPPTDVVAKKEITKL